MSESGARTRAAAARVVDAVTDGGRSLDAAIAEFEAGVAPQDRSLLRLLAYGTLRRHWQIGAWLDELLARPLRRRDRIVHALLAVGLYQLTDTRVPDHAAVSETVEASRLLGRPKLAGLVNACLRRFRREDLAALPPGGDEARWNHPAWLLAAIRRDWPEDWQGILEANNARAPMWLRANSRRQSAHDYRERLAAAGIHAECMPGLDDALRLAEPCPVEALPGFASGDVSVQDGAAQIAAGWLLDRPAQRVLDACAAPGGKTGHLLERGVAGLELVAIDNDASRAEGIRENLSRLGYSATIVVADASNPEDWWDGRSFDAILLDAPCSASGVIRRHPDIRLLRRESDIATLAGVQRALLDALWPLLGPGGRLLYATCSVLAAENDAVVGAFLAANADATENTVLPDNNIRALMRRKACGYQVLPGTADLDGFYYACLEKKVS